MDVVSFYASSEQVALQPLNTAIMRLLGAYPPTFLVSRISKTGAWA